MGRPFITIGNRKVGEDYPPLVIAEIGINHGGDLQVAKQMVDEGLIFHSDLGTQYTSDEFAKTIQEFKMTHSFSYKGSPYDNACMESFHAILKKEEVNHVQYYDFHSANISLFKYIEGWYNRKRIHGSIGYKTPQEMSSLPINCIFSSCNKSVRWFSADYTR